MLQDYEALILEAPALVAFGVGDKSSSKLESSLLRTLTRARSERLTRSASGCISLAEMSLSLSATGSFGSTHAAPPQLTGGLGATQPLSHHLAGTLFGSTLGVTVHHLKGSFGTMGATVRTMRQRVRAGCACCSLSAVLLALISIVQQHA